MVFEQHFIARGPTEYLNLPRDMGHHVTELLGLSVHSGFSFINNYSDSFFAVEDKSANGRRYVGIFAGGSSSDTTTAIRLFSSLLYAAKDMKVEQEEQRDAYWTNMGYFNSLRELGQAQTWIHADKDMVFKVLDDGEDMIRRISCDRKYSTDIVGFGVENFEHIRPIKHRFDLFCQSVQDCNDYAQLSCLFKAFRFAKLPSSYNISDSFVRPFVDAGAYYTLKHMIMFEGLSLGGENVADDIRCLEMHEGQLKGYMGLFEKLV